jgi:hypothetical protein
MKRTAGCASAIDSAADGAQAARRCTSLAAVPLVAICRGAVTLATGKITTAGLRCPWAVQAVPTPGHLG